MSAHEQRKGLDMKILTAPAAPTAVPPMSGRKGVKEFKSTPAKPAATVRPPSGSSSRTVITLAAAPPAAELKRSDGVYAVVIERHVKGFAKTHGNANAVVLCPEDFAEMRFSFGQTILARVASDESGAAVIARVWPFAKVPRGKARVQVFGTAIKAAWAAESQLLIEPLHRCPAVAASVVVTLTSAEGAAAAGPTAGLSAYLSQSLVGQLVLLGSEFGVSVLGSNLSLRIAEVAAVKAAGKAEPSDSASDSKQPVAYAVDDRTSFTFSATGDGKSSSSSAAAIVIRPEDSKAGAASGPGSGSGSADAYAVVGGLQRELAEVRELVELPLLRPELFAQFGVRAPRGILLHGPPGTGKTLIARAVAARAMATVFVINGPEVISKFVGESEEKLRAVFAAAHKQAPSIIFIDEIDALCPRREDATDEMQKRVVAALLTLLDGAETGAASGSGSGSGGTATGSTTGSASSSTAGGKGGSRVVVIAATNRPNALDPALRRPGRLDREVEIGIPTESARADILRALLARVPHSIGGGELAQLAAVTHGFVGADLQALVKEAALNTIQRLGLHSGSGSISGPGSAAAAKTGGAAGDGKAATDSADALTRALGGLSLVGNASESKTTDSVPAAAAALRVSYEDARKALAGIKPSAMREVMIDVPKVKWEDIGGQWEVKQKLKEAVEWPLQNPEAFTRLGIQPPKGILLYGPPGCSKTLMAKALASESSRNFIAVKGPELFSKWVGDSEKAIKEVFRKARAAAPSIVFFDEIDSIAVRRSDSGDSGGGERVAERVLSQLLIELDGIEPLRQVAVIAATNRPDIIDKALLRPGRIDRILYVSPPDEKSTAEIFAIELRRMAHAADVDPKHLASKAAGLSGAEIAAVCREAAVLAMEEDLDAERVALKHFEQALARFRPRITSEMLKFYADYQRSCGLTPV